MTTAPGDTAAEDSSEGPAPIPLTEPRGGVPAVIETADALADLITAVSSAAGPVAVDAERASGYRYGQRAYLVQLRRGEVLALIDPIAVPDLSGLSDALADSEWVLHAANQDLPCLAEVGMVPTTLFDTELAARLAGFERVGLATMTEVLLGLALAKEHSAADWSRRPLPEPWLRYAALDVEILVELRDLLERELDGQGKLGWAREEFAAILAAPPARPRQDPWRRTSGMHRIRNRRQLAVIRALWHARDDLARERDTAQGRVLPDAAIVAAALAMPTTEEALGRVQGWAGRMTRRLVPRLWPAIAEAMALGDDALPPAAIASDAPPPPSRWPDRDPVAASRLAAARESLAAIAEQHRLPVENLLTPDVVRRLAWSPPEPADSDGVATMLRQHGAREWQIGLTVGALVAAMAATAE